MSCNGTCTVGVVDSEPLCSFGAVIDVNGAFLLSL